MFLNNHSVIKIFFVFAFIFYSVVLYGNHNKNNREKTSNDSLFSSVIKSKTHRDNIFSVLLYKKNLDLSDPVIKINSNEFFEFRFDVLDSEIESFQYKIIHCNENWTKSDLDEMEYLDGFNDNYIETYKHSFNTIQQYVHYYLEFPNENIRLKKSGNYVIVVFKENEPNNILITHRFYVTENNIQVVPDIKYPTNLEYKYHKQEVDFNILFTSNLISNPFSNLKVVIEQNRRTDNACKYLKPNYAKQDELIFNYDDDNVFEGGNEYRHVDLTTVRRNTDRVGKIVNENDGYSAYLIPDNKRTYKKYLEYQDINGRFLIKTIDKVDSHLESEYVKVFFSVPYKEPFSKGDIYIYGGFTNWEINPNYKMYYNYDTKSYEGEVYLKQGYYNYSYICKKDGDNFGSLEKIEGSHFNTENEYVFKIYYSDPSDFYDRLLLYYIANSRDGF